MPESRPQRTDAEPEAEGGRVPDARAEASAAAQDMVEAVEEKAAMMADRSETAVPADTTSSTATGEGAGPGFRFFKRKGKAAAAVADGSDPEDDVFLLGLEQEMLATRQLYLDGLISKEVYVTETRALYDKAQSRMT